MKQVHSPFIYLRTSCILLVSAWLSGSLAADESLKGIACRSVHLGYKAAEGDAFYCEAEIRESAPGTYFMVCGFGMGYFGIQELSDGKKVVLFSVWEPGEQNNPNATPDDRRVKTLSSGDGVRVKRFGGEGTGGQSFFDYEWEIGKSYRFLVLAKRQEQRTEYTGYFYHPEREGWQQMATFSTLADGQLLKGYYSFVEDFARNRVSTTQRRVAYFFNGWVRTADGNWQFLESARFTADANPVTNINAGIEGTRYFLATGGDTKNDGTALRETVQIDTSAIRVAPPTDLPSIE